MRLLRLDRAANLLATTDWPLEPIAERTGFSSSFHLSRAFKQAYGESPSRFRDKVQTGQRVPLDHLVTVKQLKTSVFSSE